MNHPGMLHDCSVWFVKVSTQRIVQIGNLNSLAQSLDTAPPDAVQCRQGVGCSVDSSDSFG